MRQPEFHDRTCDMLAFLVEGPRTRKELSYLAEIGSQTVGVWLRALEKRGLITSESIDGAPSNARLWRWAR